MYVPHVVTGRFPGWVGTGSDISTVSIDQVIAWTVYGVKAQLDERVEFTWILFWNELAMLMVWLDEK